MEKQESNRPVGEDLDAVDVASVDSPVSSLGLREEHSSANRDTHNTSPVSPDRIPSPGQASPEDHHPIVVGMPSPPRCKQPPPPRVHLTSFSVADILDPGKFTKPVKPPHPCLPVHWPDHRPRHISEDDLTDDQHDSLSGKYLSYSILF